MLCQIVYFSNIAIVIRFTVTFRYRLKERKRATTIADAKVEAIQKRSHEPIYKTDKKKIKQS